jgi:Na+/proline symporter
MAGVLQLAFFDHYGIRFEVTVLVTVLLIWLYTFRSGIKTVVITDLLQTTLLLAAAILTVGIIVSALDLNWGKLTTLVSAHPKTQIFVWDGHSDRFFPKLFLTGVFMTIVQNGLDQSIMQKHLTCPNLRDARKNMFWFGGFLLVANLLFLVLGLLLHVFAEEKGIPLPENSDDLYPLLALNHFGSFAGIIFLLGISAAAYSSADSALTGLTTSFCVDFLGFAEQDRPGTKRTRSLVHLGFALMLFVVIVLFKSLNNDSVINSFIRISGYTFGPLLGLFMFGMFTKIQVQDRAVPFICVLSPALSYLIALIPPAWLWGYQFGFEILIVNALITVAGLLLFRKPGMRRSIPSRGNF